MKETLVLIHGFGEDAQIWEPLIPSLQENYSLIIPDLPGSGTNAADITGVSMESLAAFILEKIDAAGISDCWMIGHSMGGYITLAFAENYPDRLKGFGLFHSTAFADSEEKKTARQKNIDFISKHGSAKFLEQSVPKLFSEEFAGANPTVVKQLIDRYRDFSPDSLIHYTKAMMNRPDRIQVLEQFKKPVLFIMGEYDTAVPLEQGLKQCSIPEFSYIYIAAHSGHMGMLEETEFCLNAIKEFLAAEQ